MIHVITGAPCSGKSTYCREHMAKGDVLVDFDAIATALGSSEPHRSEGAVRDVAFAVREAAIDRCIAKGHEAWIIHTSPSEEHMARYEECGAEFIEMETTQEECLARVGDRPDGTAEAILAWFEERKDGQMLTKSTHASVKADEGIIKLYAATFDREPDSYGDVIAKGAFADCIARLEERGEKVPLLFGHRTDDPFMNIGIVEKMEEDDRGLLCEARFDLDNDNAAYCRKLVQEGRLLKCSFAYEVLDEAPVELEGGVKANELRKLNVFEVSLVPIPANRHAEVVEVKARELEDIERRLGALEEAISGLTPAGDSEEEEIEEKANAEDPMDNAEEPNRELLDLMQATIERLERNE